MRWARKHKVAGSEGLQIPESEARTWKLPDL